MINEKKNNKIKWLPDMYILCFLIIWFKKLNIVAIMLKIKTKETCTYSYEPKKFPSGTIVQIRPQLVPPQLQLSTNRWNSRLLYQHRGQRSHFYFFRCMSSERMSYIKNINKELQCNIQMDNVTVVCCSINKGLYNM